MNWYQIAIFSKNGELLDAFAVQAVSLADAKIVGIQDLAPEIVVEADLDNVDVVRL